MRMLLRLTFLRFVQFLACVSSASSLSDSTATSLADFYVDNLNRVALTTASEQPRLTASLVRFERFTSTINFYGAVGLPCKVEPTVINASVLSARQFSEVNAWRAGGPEGCGPDFFVGPPPVIWRLQDDITFGEPVRRKALDGSEFDASPMTIVRDKAPWVTYFWGYRLGLAESRGLVDAVTPAMTNWPRDQLPTSANDFALLSLPPPIAEGTVTEYLNKTNFPNAPGGNYFYASKDEERVLLDAQPAWVRTGKTFKHGGYVQVCRFYGSVSPGPNTHFYTASDKDCALLKSLQIKPTPTDRQQFNYEGVAFFANMPIPPKAAGQNPTCPSGSMPLYRAYNAAVGSSGKRNYDSNHRYSISRADIAEVVAKGWIDEGIQMCVPGVTEASASVSR
jgi:Repeat of unknown function (DUF5648)